MEVSAYFQYILALMFVLALILIIAYGAKKLGLMARVTTGSAKTQDKRLNIVEILPVDARRKLMIIRRDNVEHLILLGLDRDIIIEQNIQKNPYKTTRNMSNNIGNRTENS